MPRKNKQHKIQMRLKARQREFEDTQKSRSDNGRGFNRPGSLSGKK